MSDDTTNYDTQAAELVSENREAAQHQVRNLGALLSNHTSGLTKEQFVVALRSRDAIVRELIKQGS